MKHSSNSKCTIHLYMNTQKNISDIARHNMDGSSTAHTNLHHHFVRLHAREHLTAAAISSRHHRHQLLQHTVNGRMSAREIQTPLKTETIAPWGRNHENNSIVLRASGRSNSLLPLRWKLLHPVPANHVTARVEGSRMEHGSE